MKENKEQELPTKKGIMKLAEWLAYCISIGWSKEDLDALEKLWWKYKDKNGNLKKSDPSPTEEKRNEGMSLSNVTRVELISYPNKGRVFVNWNIKKTELSLQDNGATLKVFVWESSPDEH